MKTTLVYYPTGRGRKRGYSLKMGESLQLIEE
jgi:hypothetical protein